MKWIVNKTRKFGYFLTLALVWANGCQEDSMNNMSVPDGERDIALRLALPYATPATRAISAAQEYAVQTLDVLSFKKEANGEETFLYWTGAKKVAEKVDDKTIEMLFNVRLRVMKDDEQRFVFISNARDKLEALLSACPDECWAGVEKNDLLSRLVLELKNGERWNVIGANAFIPMWGESKTYKIDATKTSITNDGPIQMMRMLAKIEVVLKDHALNNFLLKSVHVYNTNSSGRIVPLPENVGLDANMKKIAKNVSLPVPVETVLGPLTYTDFGLPGTMNEAMKSAIYLFETAAKNEGDRLEETCIVLGGYYGTDTCETFYRLDFLDGTLYRDILRNHAYICNITAVTGRGYPSVDEAFRLKPFNMDTEIIEWNGGGDDIIIDNKQYELIVSQNRFVFDAETHDMNSTNNILAITTDYPKGWTAIVSKIKNDTIPAPDDFWLKITSSHGAGGDKPETARLLLDNNTRSVVRTAWIYIRAGRLYYEVTVTQVGSGSDIEDSSSLLFLCVSDG